MTSTYSDISLDAIRPSQTSAQASRRAAFDKAALAELAESVRADGVVQAIIVRPTTKDAYEIVAGERRFLAAGMAGLERIPCNVRELTDEQVVKLQLIENLQREDLHPMHEAESYEELKTKHGYTVDEIYPDVGKSKAYVYGRLKLLALSKACRKAFYAGEISASIAEKLARIPVESVQDQSLEAVLGNPHAKETWKRREPMSFRDAVEHINEHYMLELKLAPFPVADEKLNGAGPCGKCPKNTGNAPDLFGDVKAGLCTDPVCFAAKARAYGQRLLEEAKKTGQHTITGGAAKKIAPDGLDGYGLREGYHLADKEAWVGSTRAAPRKLLKPDETTALLQDPKSGRVVEVVHDSQLKKPKREQGGGEVKWKKERKDQAARAKIETAVRRSIFAAVAAKGKWKAPPLCVLAELVAESIDYNAGEALMDLLEIPESKTKGFFDRITGHVKSLKTDEQLGVFLAQAYLADDLHVNSYSVSPKMPRLEAAAKVARVDVAKIRRELAPKKKPAKKSKAKK